VALAAGLPAAACTGPAVTDGAEAGVPLRERLAHVAPVRALRCAWAAPPLLAGRDGAAISYRHVGDDDPAADRLITLTSAGVLTVRARTGASVSYAVGPQAAARLFRIVDAERLLCAATVPRYGRRPQLPYRDTLAVEAGDRRRVLSVDSCHGVSDPLAFAAVSAALRALVAEAGPPAVGGGVDSGGRVAIASPCDDGLLAAVEERAGAWR
jgi:hypothetical protein